MKVFKEFLLLLKTYASELSPDTVPTYETRGGYGSKALLA